MMNRGVGGISKLADMPHTIISANQHPAVRPASQKKELMLHCLMYGVSMFNEVSELRD